MSKHEPIKEEERRAEEFRRRYKELSFSRDTNLGKTVEATLQPNPNGYNTAEIVAMKTGMYYHLIGRRKD